ncbi:MAG: GNAT family N-acetyltransferase [Erythrobacter sp.]|uniref:GNAT family N-acetyltransferase n=1 Tax=Erythrobacter sp. TaxID=1042 RepID=UPI003298E865
MQETGGRLSKEAAVVRPLDRKNTALLKSMIGLFEQGQEPHHQSFPQHFGPAVNRPAISAYLQGFLKPRNPFRSRYGFAKGLFIKDDLVGYLLYRMSETNDIFYGKPRWHCHIEDIVVHERARGLGGASALMGTLLDELSPLSECAISGIVWSGNSASQALFQKQGFKPLSQSFYKVIS